MKNTQINAVTPLVPFANLFSVKNLFHKLNFEFMDSDKLPDSLRFALRDILDVGSSAPFRSYYQWVATSIYEYAVANNIKEIIELGSGCAPITRCLIKNYPNWEVVFKVSDQTPDIAIFKALELSDKRVIPIYESLDFTKKMSGFRNSLLVFSAAFHHVPEKSKKSVLFNLTTLSQHILIFEPVCPKVGSMLLNLGVFITGALTPLFKINSKSFLRSFVWCWLIPIAPFLLLWDGTVSALRCWSKQEWQLNEPEAEIEEAHFCAKILIKKLSLTERTEAQRNSY